jgi:acetyl esterase
MTGRARVEWALAAGLDALPEAAKLRLSGRPQVVVDGAALDPGMQLMLRLLRLRRSPTFIRPDAEDAAAERRRIRRESAVAQGPRTPVALVRELAIERPRGPIGARHYAPPPTTMAGRPAPLLVYLHGGGWVVGDLDTHDELCRLLCRHAGLHVVAIDYALAPEHPFPAAVEDAVAALRWGLREAGGLGADPARVAVGGDSAGGNLAAVACQALAGEADGAAPKAALQVLLYPSVDLTATTRSGERFASGFYLDAPSRRWCEARYLSAGADRTDPRVSPARGELAGLPPAIVVTCGFDPLRDEGEAYAEALAGAGVRVVRRRAAGMLHGFANMTGINARARDAVLELAGMIRAELAQ